MSKKDRKSMEELWSKRFDEETEMTEEEPLSRKAKRDREKSISPILTVTLIFMALLIILPTSAYIWWSSREGMSEEPSGPTVEQVMQNDEEDEELEEEPEEDEEESELDDEDVSLADSQTDEPSEDSNEETEDSSVDEEDDSDVIPSSPVTEPSEPVTETPAEETTQQEEPESQPEVTEPSVPETEEETVPEQSGTTYTVKAGDNMYRIALNHGMTTEELMRLNNIQEETVHIGQELRVD